MKLKLLYSQSRSLPTKEVYPPIIIVASSVTSDLIVHSSVLKSLKSISKHPRHIMLLGINGNTPIDLFLLAISVARLVTTNPGTSNQSPISPRISTFMRGY
jgi:hypothetical protein